VELKNSKVKAFIIIILLFLSLFPLHLGYSNGILEQKKTSGIVFDDPDKNYYKNSFIQNKGQWDSEMGFFTTTSFGVVGFSENEMVFNIIQNEKNIISPNENYNPTIKEGSILKLTFKESDPKKIIGNKEILGKYNYLIGSKNDWVTGVPLYQELYYEDIWEGIDLKYHHSVGNLKYEFLLDPFASPSSIVINIEGGEYVQSSGNDLFIHLNEEVYIQDSNLFVHYADKEKEAINAEFSIIDATSYTFQLETYDRTRPIIIDPLYLSSFIGGYGEEKCNGVGVDNKGNPYITGYTTYSDIGDFPTTPGAYSISRKGTSYDAYITKFHYSGSDLFYSTFIGGNGDDYAMNLHVDEYGFSYITGYTNYSSSEIFPTTSGAYQRSFTYNNYTEAFLVKLSTDGSSLVYSTLIGGAFFDYAYDVDVDRNGNATIVGCTQYSSLVTSEYGDYPYTKGAFQSRNGTSQDAFITTFDSKGANLIFSTYLGGNQSECAFNVVMNSNQEIYLSGNTTSLGFPVTFGAFDTTYNGGNDVFISKIVENGTLLGYSTLIGGNGDDCCGGLDVDDNGNTFICGFTNTTSFPTTLGAYSTSYTGGSHDTYITKINSTGKGLIYSTYLGSSEDDISGYDSISVGSNGNVYFIGSTNAKNTDSKQWPITSGAYQTNNAGGYDFFFVNLSANGNSISHSSLFGGSDNDYGLQLVIDTNNIAYLSGYTFSSDFPTTSGSYDRSIANSDAVLLKYGENIQDDRAPIFTSDLSDQSAHASCPFTFRVNVTDNFGITGVFVEYWLGNFGIHTNKSFKIIPPYNMQIILPSQINIKLNYFFSASDFNGNWANSSIVHKIITDVTPPAYTAYKLEPTEVVSGTQSISIDWKDNIKISSTYLFYRTNKSLPYIQILSLSFSTNMYHFNFNLASSDNHLWYYSIAFDNSSNNATTPVKHQRVNRPQFYNSGITPLNPTTGEAVNLSINITDNGKIDTNSLKLHYNDDGAWHSISLKHYKLNRYYAVINPDGSLLLSYNYSASDYIHTNYSQTFTVDVVDNDNPTFIDKCKAIGSTGDSYIFNIKAFDNIKIGNIRIDWTHNMLGGTEYLEDNSDGTFSKTIILDHSLSNMVYRIINVKDTTGNMVFGTNTNVTVYDNDKPTFSNISIDPANPETGDELTLTVDVSDNIGYQGNTVEFFYRDTIELFKSIYLSQVSGNTYSGKISIGNYYSRLYYYFRVIDNSLNIGTSSIDFINISDNKAPTLISDNTDKYPTTGDQITFNITMRDNVGIGRVFVEFWYGTHNHSIKNLSVVGYGLGSNQFGLTTTRIPLSSLDSINYFYDFWDKDGNHWASGPSSVVTLKVTDNDCPEIKKDLSNETAFTGDLYQFKIYLFDNIDNEKIVKANVNASYGWDWSSYTNYSLSYDSITSAWISSTFYIQHTLSPLTYYIFAIDKAGNWMQNTNSTPVMDNDKPTFSWPDSSQLTANTGDPFNFTLISVQDNIDIKKVQVNIEYPGFVTYSPQMTEISMGIYSLIFILPHSIITMRYNFTVIDTSDNFITTLTSTRTPVDNDPPEIFSDMTPKTGFAGADFYFKTLCNDNIELIKLDIEYKYSWSSTSTVDVMTSLSGDVFYYYIHLPVQAGKIEYRFIAKDYMNFETITGWKELEIIDNLPPEITNLIYPEYGYTGDEIKISVEVNDDVGIEKVVMWYFFGYDNPILIESTSTSGIYSFSTIAPNKLTRFSFYIQAWDLVGNTIQNEVTSIFVLDNDLPTVLEDLSDIDGTTGDYFMFKLNVTDNIDMEGVEVNYIIPGEDWKSHSLTFLKEKTYYWRIQLLNDHIGTLTYYFRVWDTSNNEVTVPNVGVEIFDDEQPIAIIVGPKYAYQNEEVIFCASKSSDNIEIVSYIWSINNEAIPGENITYSFPDAGIYLIELNVYDGINPISTSNYTISIKDNEIPIIVIEGLSEKVATHIGILVNATNSTDNIGIISYKWLLVLQDNTKITGFDPVFEYNNIQRPSHVTLYLSISDVEGNTDKGEYKIEVVDILPPTVKVPLDVKEKKGTVLRFTDELSTDNIGIIDWIWLITYNHNIETTISGKTFSYLFDKPGLYNITLTVVDSSNNSAYDYFHIIIIEDDQNSDTDQDGMPDWWEDESGLDKTIDDSQRDYDNDLLTNLKEYELGTNPKNSDTDRDGMPDNWEYTYGFDELFTNLNEDGIPLWMIMFTSDGDLDGDGDTNLEEYLEGGRDPTIMDAKDQKEDNTFIYLIIVIIVILFVLFLISMSVIIFSRIKSVEEEFPKSKYPQLYKRN